MNYKLDASIGNDFNSVSKKAKEIAKEKSVTVEFEFNTIICLVDANTNLDWLFRDYMNAHTMEWKTIGFICLPEYDKETQTKLDNRNNSAELKRKKQREESNKREEKEKSVFNKKVEGISIELKDTDGWKDTVDKNTDPYGKCAVDYAEGWAKLMQVEISKGKGIIECAERTSHELSFYGITGFMYGCAVSMLSNYWKHGEELRKWHNKEYNHEGEGVVNPAVLTISK